MKRWNLHFSSITLNVRVDQYDNGEVGYQNQTPLEMDILNSNFIVQEVEAAI